MAPPAGANGIIPVTALQKNPPASAPRGPKAPAPRLKLVLRRLPPGLTKAEFETLLGDEWKVGAGKIDWLNYNKGKISKDVAKPSKPSRVYIHVTQQAHVAALGDHVREVTFHDAAKSFQDNALVGPPALEYAPYPKMPGGRRRNDARQGTIDQDPEFKEFLESLTAPLTKPAAPDADAQKEEKVKTTPLIEALREKKANKDKPQGKNKGRGDTKETAAEKKLLTKPGKDGAPAAGEKNRNMSKAEKERAQKEAVKALNKEAALRGGTGNASTDKSTTPAPERKRGNISIAKSMLQRDLGLAPAPNKRRGTKREVNPVAQETPAQDENTPNTSNKHKGKEPSTASGASAAATSSEKNTSTPTRKERPSRAERRAFKASQAEKSNTKAGAEDSKTSTKPAASTPTILKKPQSAQNQASSTPKGSTAARPPPTEPSAARNAPSTPQSAPARPANPTPAHASQAPPAPTPAGKQAFLKHANASQGITEQLIEEALKSFGAIDKVEIDKRKGFAYVDFANPEGLVKAIAASPVKVAQGAVQILERKEKVARNRPFTGPPTGPAARGGRGGFAQRVRGGRGGGNRASNASNADASTTAVPASAPAVAVGGDAAT